MQNPLPCLPLYPSVKQAMMSPLIGLRWRMRTNRWRDCLKSVHFSIFANTFPHLDIDQLYLQYHNSLILRWKAPFIGAYIYIFKISTLSLLHNMM